MQPSEKAMAPHSSTRAWKIPWTEEPDRLQSMGSLRVGHDWATSLSLFTFMHSRRKWQPTPVFLPRESQGRGSLVGCGLWGCAESDTTEVTSQQQQQQQQVDTIQSITMYNTIYKTDRNLLCDSGNSNRGSVTGWRAGLEGDGREVQEGGDLGISISIRSIDTPRSIDIPQIYIHSCFNNQFLWLHCCCCCC